MKPGSHYTGRRNPVDDTLTTSGVRAAKLRHTKDDKERRRKFSLADTKSQDAAGAIAVTKLHGKTDCRVRRALLLMMSALC